MTERRQSTEKIYALVAKGDTEGAKIEVLTDYIHCQKQYP